MGTRQSAIIHRTIESLAGHPTAEDIYLQAKGELPHIAMGTVYRNLNAMVEAGEIRKLHTPEGPDRFDSITTRHDHLVCDGCGRIDDVMVDGVEALVEAAAGEGYRGYELEVHHLCEKCRAGGVPDRR